MRRLLALPFAAVSLTAALLPATAGGRAVIRSPRPIPGRYIVTLEPGTTGGASFGTAAVGASVAGFASDLALAYQGRVHGVYEHALRGFVVELSPAQAAALARDLRVAAVEEDGEMSIAATEANATWGLDRIDQRALPLDRSYTYGATGGGVTAYVIDTGIRATHSEFAGRVLAGYTAINDGNGTNDCNGHGTHVSGTIAGAVYGVAKQASLVPVRVLDCNGSGSTSGVIAGVDWVTKNHRTPAVANMSLGGGASSTLDQAVRNSIAAGVTYAVAAGNDNADACSGSPSRVAEALTVGATAATDARASYSNYGPCVDLFAPGSSITSSWNTSDAATNTISGTSMATPHVTGSAALYLAAHPAAAPAEVASALTGNATPGKVTNAGPGSPNRLLYEAFIGGTPTDQPPVASFTYSCAGLSCSFDGRGSSDDHGVVGYDWDFGDGVRASGSTSTHLYTTPGTFTVRLTVTDTAGQAGAAAQSVPVTDGGGAPCTSCEHYGGSLAGTGSVQYQPNGNWFYSSATGTHQGWLRGPAAANFDLLLQKWSSRSGWVTVAKSTGGTASESVTYSGTAGYYVWRIVSVAGGGAYDFWMKRP